jgi:predicted DNA binding CopG/RHH family protein
MKAKKVSKRIVLDEFERKVLKDYKEGKYVDVTTPERQKELQRIAGNTVEESRKGGVPINIRLPMQDLTDLRMRAEQEGLPYQTLARSILHRYVTGQLADLNHVQIFADTVFEKLSRGEESKGRRVKTG